GDTETPSAEEESVGRRDEETGSGCDVEGQGELDVKGEDDDVDVVNDSVNVDVENDAEDVDVDYDGEGMTMGKFL
ncbi:hypothetical protein F442_06928, partial [Phytophthora nicotianae P10297]